MAQRQLSQILDPLPALAYCLTVTVRQLHALCDQELSRFPRTSSFRTAGRASLAAYRASGTAETGSVGLGAHDWRSRGCTRQQSGSSEGRPSRTTQHSNQRSVSNLFRMAKRRRVRRRNSRLSSLRAFGRTEQWLQLKNYTPIFPGEILNEDYLIPAGISINRLAMDIHVPVSRVYEIVKGERAITADTALRLARYLGTRRSSG